MLFPAYLALTCVFTAHPETQVRRPAFAAFTAPVEPHRVPKRKQEPSVLEKLAELQLALFWHETRHCSAVRPDWVEATELPVEECEHAEAFLSMGVVILLHMQVEQRSALFVTTVVLDGDAE